MSAAPVVLGARTPGQARRVLAHRILAGVLALSLLSGGLHTARAASDDGTPDSKVGVLMAVMCGFALKWVLPAPVPWAGVAAAACTFAFLDAATSPDDAGPGKP